MLSVPSTLTDFAVRGKTQEVGANDYCEQIEMCSWKLIRRARLRRLARTRGLFLLQPVLWSLSHRQPGNHSCQLARDGEKNGVIGAIEQYRQDRLGQSNCAARRIPEMAGPTSDLKSSRTVPDRPRGRELYAIASLGEVDH